MPQKTGKSALGQSLINSRAKKARKLRKHNKEARTENVEEDNGDLSSDDLEDEAKPIMSITDETDLEAFLSKAQLAGKEFVAEKSYQKVILEGPSVVGVRLETCQIDQLLEKHKQYLVLPRRPHWNVTTTKQELLAAEQDSFLHWRRNIATLEEVDGVVLTPFERNLELWRELWRVVERSHIVVQIVDARNALLFRSEDLESMVKETDQSKINLLLLNKADLLSPVQRSAWGKYFRSRDVQVAFFSAIDTAETLSQPIVDKGKDYESVQEIMASLVVQEEGQSSQPLQDALPKEELASEKEYIQTNPDDCISAQGFLALLKDLGQQFPESEKLTIGMVGYPNVGKSSTINKVLGSKKVSVSITPGKTKRLQTLPIDERLMLCDCPGLVMPSLTLNREEMLVNGILPADQMRSDGREAVALLVSRFPTAVWEDTYGISVPIGDGAALDPRDLLTSIAFNRGYMSAKGIPDASRAARVVIKDVISGKLCWAVAPPTVNQQSYNDFHRKSAAHQSSGSVMNRDILAKRNLLSVKPDAEKVDSEFFGSKSVGAGVMGGKKMKSDSKKHGNRGRKQKLRRIYSDLDA